MHAYVQGQGGGGGGRAVNSTREQPRGRYNDGYERRGNEQSSPNKIIISSTRSNFHPFLPSSLVGGFLLRADRAANNRGVFRKASENANMWVTAPWLASQETIGVRGMYPLDRYYVPYSLVNIILGWCLRYFFSRMYLSISLMGAELEERRETSNKIEKEMVSARGTCSRSSAARALATRSHLHTNSAMYYWHRNPQCSPPSSTPFVSSLVWNRTGMCTRSMCLDICTYVRLGTGWRSTNLPDKSSLFSLHRGTSSPRLF